MVVYYVVCFFLVLLLWVGSDNVAFVRIRSTTYVCLLHGLVLLPCGISGKMTMLGNVAENKKFPTFHQDQSKEMLATRERE